MKKLKLLMMLCLFCIATAKADTEPNNNTAAGADATTIGTTESGNTINGDFDYYSFSTASDGDITISITTANGALVYFNLIDADGSTNLGGTYLYGGNSSTTVNGLAAGNYYILVQGSGLANSYSVTPTLTLRTYSNDVESNNTSATASAMNLNTSVQ